MHESASAPFGRRSLPRWFPLVCLGFVIVGVGLLVVMLAQARRDYRIAYVYKEAQCEVLDRATESFRAPSYSSNQRRSTSTRVVFTFRFKTEEGLTITARGFDNYRGKGTPRAEADRFRVGQSYPCWYDPDAPDQAVILRRFNPHYYWALLMPLGMISIAGVFLRESLRPVAYHSRITRITAGRQLAQRLPPVTSHRGMIGCMGAAAILFAGVTVGFYLAATAQQSRSTLLHSLSSTTGTEISGWWFIVAVTAAVTLLFLWGFAVNLRWAGIPEPVVEVDHATLAPGATGQLHIVQSGPFRADSFDVLLVCETVGKNARATVVEERLLHIAPLEIPDAQSSNAREFTAQFTIPYTAAPSCNSQAVMGSPRVPAGKREQRIIAGYGEPIYWILRVQRKMDVKTALETDFEIVVERSNQRTGRVEAGRK